MPKKAKAIGSKATRSPKRSGKKGSRTLNAREFKAYVSGLKELAEKKQGGQDVEGKKSTRRGRREGL